MPMKTPESVLKKEAAHKKQAEAKAAAAAEAEKKAVADIAKFKANSKKYDEEYAAAEKEAIENQGIRWFLRSC
jgi:hypothetical protein